MMNTEVLPANKAAIEEAVRILKGGGLVAFPTDTVYGVGAHAFQPQAVERLYIAKARPKEKAIPLLLARVEDLNLVAKDVPDIAWPLIERFWPGGLTLVVPRSELVPDVVTSGLPNVAVRMPNHPVAISIIEALGAPLAATSANISGHPSPVAAEGVEKELGGRIELIVDGGICPGGIPSTVLDLTTDPPLIRRRGAISVGEIEAVLPRVMTEAKGLGR